MRERERERKEVRNGHQETTSAPKCLLDASSSLPVVPRQRQTLGEKDETSHATSDPGWRARFPARLSVHPPSPALPRPPIKNYTTVYEVRARAEGERG